MADPPTILVVDDQPPNLRLIDAILQPGATDVARRSGEEAIEVLHRERIDLVLLDILMPGMDGYEVADGSASTPPRSSSRS